MIADEELPADGNGEGGAQDIHQDNDAEEVLETGELALDDGEDERLPWLESDEDDSEEQGGGRIVGFAALGFAAIAAVVAGIWWLSHSSPDKTLVADGSVIEAPSQPYKEAPKDAGGKTFQGTGDSAFAVSQGQSQGATQVSASGAASGVPQPGITIPPSGATASPSAAASAPAAAAGAPGTMVQIGAFRSRAVAESSWSTAAGKYSALSGQRHVVVEGQADIGTVFRLQIPGGSAEGARALCGRLKGQGLDCQVK